MICLKCGCCCIYLDVAIVNPKSIRLDGTVDPENCETVIFKPKGQICPHLIRVQDKAVCKIHELPCYMGTPCQQFEQVGREDDVCMMRSYFYLVHGNPLFQRQFKGAVEEAEPLK